ncbi:hypothetical protein [Sphingosinicella terrae]|uniref:hypothetical protein n=1 Tax=Sphingosinicella terrae TaxID=2172047 RepID=UPI000E0D07BD|nr:hypothetical protein [Sphingosinicella terrae]
MIVEMMIAILVHSAQPADMAEEETTFSERQPVRLAPVPAARALATFREACMATFPDPVAFDRAVAASDLGFALVDEPERGAREWSSRHGQILLRQAEHRERDARRERRQGRTPRLRWDTRCDLWVAIEERMEPEALVAIIGAALAPQARPVEEILGASWDLPSDPAAPIKLYYLPTLEDPRIFTLSLQRFAAPAPRPR